MRKYSRINKNRKTDKNRSYLRMKKEYKARKFRFAGTEIEIHLNHNGGICDVQPRLAFDQLYGRQWGLQSNYDILRTAIIEIKKGNNV